MWAVFAIRSRAKIGALQAGQTSVAFEIGFVSVHRVKEEAQLGGGRSIFTQHPSGVWILGSFEKLSVPLIGRRERIPSKTQKGWRNGRYSKRNNFLRVTSPQKLYPRYASLSKELVWVPCVISFTAIHWKSLQLLN